MEDTSPGSLQSYYDWQMSTLMLAYDLADPLPNGDDEAVEARRDEVARELAAMVQQIVPREFLDDPDRDFPPDVMMGITRATLERAATIAGIRVAR
ncbi:MAG: hypothetical protein WD009_02950 [Phycisphaeraceae bacterium]